MKKILFYLVFGFVWVIAVEARAQFWNYDDGDNEAQIPAECDGVFDESRGGVFMPTAEEMAARGEEFLLDPDPVIRRKAGYCLIAAALLGNVQSQYRVAQLYAKGVVLPQDDLSAYRWAFMASLNGHKDAEKMALLLERFLTTQDITMATTGLQAVVPEINARYKRELMDQMQKVKRKQAELDRINDEIDIILGIKVRAANAAASASSVQETVDQIAMKASPQGSVFSDQDRPR